MEKGKKRLVYSSLRVTGIHDEVFIGINGGIINLGSVLLAKTGRNLLNQDWECQEKGNCNSINLLYFFCNWMVVSMNLPKKMQKKKTRNEGVQMVQSGAKFTSFNLFLF